MKHIGILYILLNVFLHVKYHNVRPLHFFMTFTVIYLKLRISEFVFIIYNDPLWYKFVAEAEIECNKKPLLSLVCQRVFLHPFYPMMMMIMMQ